MHKMLIIALVVLLCVCLIGNGCASIIHPSRSSRPKEARGGIDWVSFLGNFFIFGGVIGLIVDFANGNIYSTKIGYRDQYGQKLPDKTLPDDEDDTLPEPQA